jgi:hypothetical protein
LRTSPQHNQTNLPYLSYLHCSFYALGVGVI